MASNKVPKHLKGDIAAWWSSVVAEFELEEHWERVLTLACDAWDRAQAAREALDALGTTYTNRFGQPKARPEVAIERDARIAFARLIRELDLEGEPGGEPRPPRRTG
jgi:P27 family predicted phage terminase small subunit